MRLGLLSAAWLAGILLGLEFQADLPTAWILAVAAGLLALGLLLARLPALPALLVAVLLLGVGRAELHDRHQSPPEFLGQQVIATGTISSDPETTARRVRFEVEVSTIESDGEQRGSDERWLVYGAPSGQLVSNRTPPYFRYGDSVVVDGTPLRPEPIEGFDYAAHLESQGIRATVFAERVEVTGTGGARWKSAMFAARRQLAESIERSMPYPESALAAAMLLGKREYLPPELVERFRATGAAHLLAISGLHVGVLLAVTAGTAAWLLGRQRPTYLVITGLVVWLYALAAGASPSALRAATMGTIYLAAIGLGRPSSVLPALALAAAAMTAASPALIRQISFQLSFAAMGGIALALALSGGGLAWGRSPSSGWVRRLAGWVVSVAVISAAATLATWPLAAVNFDRVALLSVPVSLITVPVMAPLIVTAFVSATAGLMFGPLGELLGWIATAPTAYLIGVVSAFPPWTVQADWVGRPLLLGWYGFLGIALLAAQPQRVRQWRKGAIDGFKRMRALFGRGSPDDAGSHRTGGLNWRLPNAYATAGIALATGVAAVILLLRLADGPDGRLHVYFLDIGQGDSTLIVSPAGKQVLIDGGPDGDVTSEALADVLPGGDRSLDLVVMTHLDSDHSHGLFEVLDRYTAGGVVVGPVPGDAGTGAEWEQRLRQKEVTPQEVRAGYRISLEENIVLEVINPPAGDLLGDSNNDSVAMRLIYGQVSVLLTADMEREAEERLLNSGTELSSTVLKVGHHGSNTSSTQQFLVAVDPAVAVISAGYDNPYGHPAVAVLERLEGVVGAANVYRTDQQGTIEIVSDGTKLWVNTER